jgi:hypothetical protein
LQRMFKRAEPKTPANKSCATFHKVDSCHAPKVISVTIARNHCGLLFD